MKNFKDITGKRFGRLTVIERADNYKDGSAMWKCRCDCGVVKIIKSYSLRTGTTVSCGCYKREKAIETGTKYFTHGESGTRLHNEWKSMKARCYNPNNKRYNRYGGRGITICEEWKNSFESFRDWAIANGYDDSLTLDRIDSNGDYEPSNCKWATQKEQQNNRCNNRRIEYNGKTQTITQWAEEVGIKEATLRHRLKCGWSIEKAMTEPLKNKKER